MSRRGGRLGIRGKPSESEATMKKLCVGVLLGSALLFAQTASADPCGLCQAYYPCNWPCEHCTRLWTIDGYCTGEVIQGTCGDVGQCSQLRASNGYDELFMDPGV